ncbi:hypothetical protein T265_08250 [Opisthorchis viverrini]|uniref:Uncharacterized protein n=1 Tax=Opisthorchis viverrini TaxID=6198 RepID=A0A074Z9U3_OPIVI|nr:hypothetical protein T265_08250 [Opisthorchis viverrini]KER24006.1 hypothetical protein T265_08250 [Opisthorchis viverrini]
MSHRQSRTVHFQCPCRDLNPGHLICEASVYPLLHEPTLDASEFSRLNMRTCSHLSDEISVPDPSNDDPVTVPVLTIDRSVRLDRLPHVPGVLTTRFLRPSGCCPSVNAHALIRLLKTLRPPTTDFSLVGAQQRLKREAAWCSTFSRLETSKPRDSAGFQTSKLYQSQDWEVPEIQLFENSTNGLGSRMQAGDHSIKCTVEWRRVADNSSTAHDQCHPSWGSSGRGSPQVLLVTKLHEISEIHSFLRGSNIVATET